MKKIIFALSIFCFIYTLNYVPSPAFPGDENKKSGLCLSEYSKIIEYYEKKYSSEQVYFKFLTQKLQDNRTGEKLTNEMWVKGSKFRYKNEFIQVYQDEINQVLILKESRKIIIKRADSKEVQGSYGVPSKALIDSLIKISSEIQCTRNQPGGVIFFKFPRQVAKKMNPVKEVRVFYNLESGKVSKAEFDYFSDGPVKRDIYEYVTLSKTFDDKILQGSAVSKALIDNAPRNEYKGYEVRDLRIIPD